MNFRWNNLANGRGRDAESSEHGGHAPHDALVVAIDPRYWPRALALRVTVALSYFVLIPAGLLPMSTAWWLVSGGSLVTYSTAVYAVYRLKPEAEWIYKSAAMYVDVLAITLATIALARPDYPIWVGYLLVVSSLSAVHNSRYVLLFALWAIVAYWGGIAILDASGRAEPSLQLAAVVSIMLVFTAINSEVISTSNRRLQEMVLHASLTDPLTGLANRRRFREILEAHHSLDARPLAVLMYDVDNFKQINEERGHVAADGVLIRICDELCSALREADVVARYGGDELIALCHVASIADARLVAERSLEHIRASTGVELSVGIAVFPFAAATLDETVRAADDALGIAKRAGKARAVVYMIQAAA